MRTPVGAQEAVNVFNFEESTYGLEDPAPAYFRDLFLGRPGESANQRAARMAAARDVLAELQEQGETDHIARQDALYAEKLSSVVPLGNATSDESWLLPEGKAA